MPENVQEDAAAVDAATVKKPSQPSGISFGMAVMVTAMMQILIGTAMLFAYHHYFAPQFVSVDVKGFVQQQQDLYVAGKINDDQLRNNYQALKTVVSQIPANKIVLMGDAVLGGNVEKIDVTSK